jgi:hypothetical protein
VSKEARLTLLAALIYTVGAVVFTWPLPLHLRSFLGAIDVPADPSLNLWVLGWDLQTLSTHPFWLVSGRVFDANIYFPATQTLAYSDHLLLQALFLWPVYALSHDLVLCYNVLLLGSLIAAALAMHVLVRTVVGQERSAYVAGLIFGFAPYHFTHLTHIQLQGLYFLPLSFLCLHRLFRDGRAKDTLLLGLVVGLQAVSSLYYGIIGGIGLMVAALAAAVMTRRLLDWRLVGRGLGAAALAVLVAAPWSVPYLRVQSEAAGGRNLYEAANGSAALSSYVQAPETNVLYGKTGWLRPSPSAWLARKDGPEQGLFPGFLALLLALLGLAAAPAGLKQTAIVYVAVAVAGVVLSLGPEGVRPLYAALHRVIFGMAVIRAPARFSVLTLCGLAVLAGLAVRVLQVRAPQAQTWLLGVIVAVIGLEYVNAAPFPGAPALTSNAGRWLRDQPGKGPIICLPMGLFTGNTPCMLQSLEHGHPIVNGYSGVRPPFFEAVAEAVSRVPGPESLVALHDLGVEYVVSARPLSLEGPAATALVERTRFTDQHVYQMNWTPELETLLASAGEATPPEPGPATFVPGERATYRVLWTSGPMRVPAGDATIAVVPPQGPERFRFVVSARTAPWVSRFYEADVTVESTASARLLPLTYREAILDGKRRIERHLSFDVDRREVRIASGGSTITLPVGPDARDPLTALFYLRTLPFDAGSHFTLPLNDNGRRLRLDVAVGRSESLLVGGQPWSAWKLEPRLGDRIDRPDRLTFAAWVSADPRHIPLLVEVGAPFGSVRVELADYQQQ